MKHIFKKSVYRIIHPFHCQNFGKQKAVIHTHKVKMTHTPALTAVTINILVHIISASFLYLNLIFIK